MLAFFAFLTLGQSMTSGDNLEKRMKAVANRREELRRLSRQGVAKDNSGALRQTDTSPYRALVEKLNLKKLLEDPKVVEKLSMAGFRGPKPISTFYFFRLAMPFVLGAIAAFYTFVMDIGHLQTQMKLLVQCRGLCCRLLCAQHLYLQQGHQKTGFDRRGLSGCP